DRAKRRPEQRGNVLGQRQAAGIVEVLAHPGRVHLQASQQFGPPGRGRAGQPEQVAERLPLRVPGTGGALMLLLGGGGEGGEQSRHLARAAEQGDRADRVALVRHRGRAAPGTPLAARASTAWAGAVPLADLGHLGLGEQGDVPGGLAEHRGRPGRCGGDVEHPQPVGVPGQHRPGQPEFVGEQAGHPLAIAAPPNWTASRPTGTRATASRASSRLVSQPAATSPKVTGTACCSSVRPIMRVSRWVAASTAAADAAADRSAAIADSACLASSIAAVSMMSWLVAPLCTAPAASGGTILVSSRTSAGTGLPVSAACLPSPAASNASACAAAVTVAPAPGSARPALSRALARAASVSSKACSH